MPDMEYVPLGSEFDDPEDAWWDSATLPHQDIMKQVMLVCRRTSKRFKNKKERTSWKNILKKMDKGQLRREWIFHMIAWAEKKNRHNTAIPIKVDALASAVLNAGLYDDWITQNPVDPQQILSDKDLADDEY